MSAVRGDAPTDDGTNNRLITDWLARAGRSPEQSQLEWRNQGVALIPLGRLFDAVRIPESLVHSVAGVRDASTVNSWLGWSLNGGPVIHDPAGRRYYALVPPGTAQEWRPAAAQCLSEGTYLGVPHPDLTELDQGTLYSYWAVPVTRPGKLCQVSDVLTVAMVGGVLADEDDGAAS